tara:strand:+ start:4027 stop:5292 length:1266 start_codon:yes stop_codon:yes gene_type:complete
MEFLKSGNGRRFFLKDFRNAEQFKPHIAPPRQKFQGYVNFIINRKLIDNLEDSSIFRTRISSLIRTATLPEVNFQTEIKNSFNRKKIIQTGVELSPVSMTVMDTIQNEWLTLFMKYYSYHYMNPRNKFEGIERDTPYQGGDMHSGYQESKFGKVGTDANNMFAWNSNDFGMNLSVTKNFFERIDIILYHGNKGVQYSLFNPMMKGFSASELDYSSSEVMDFKLDFEYENFTTTNVYNFDLSEQDKSRFENMAGVELPGMGGPTTTPTALNDQTLTVLGLADSDKTRRPRSAQPKTGGQSGTDSYNLNNNMNTPLASPENTDAQGLYTPSKLAEDSGESGFFGGISDFLEDNPFGRMIDKGLSAAINGQDMASILKNALTDEVNYAITNPEGEPDIFNSANKSEADKSDKEKENANPAGTGT